MVATSVQRKKSTPEFKLAYTGYFDEVDPSGEDYTYFQDADYEPDIDDDKLKPLTQN